MIKLNTAIKAAALQFEKLPKDLSNVAVRSGHGLRLADVQVVCRDPSWRPWLSSPTTGR